MNSHIQNMQLHKNMHEFFERCINIENCIDFSNTIYHDLAKYPSIQHFIFLIPKDSNYFSFDLEFISFNVVSSKKDRFGLSVLISPETYGNCGKLYSNDEGFPSTIETQLFIFPPSNEETRHIVNNGFCNYYGTSLYHDGFEELIKEIFRIIRFFSQ